MIEKSEMEKEIEGDEWCTLEDLREALMKTIEEHYHGKDSKENVQKVEIIV